MPSSTLSTISISAPSVNDWQQVKAIRLAALQTDPHAFLYPYAVEAAKSDDEWKKRLVNLYTEFPQEVMMVAWDKDRIIGMIVAIPLKHQTIWDVQSFYVHPSYRQRGIGTQLFKAILEKLSTMSHVFFIDLMVNVGQTVAVQMYKNHGFSIIEVAKDQTLGDGNIYDEYIMRRSNFRKEEARGGHIIGPRVHSLSGFGKSFIFCRSFFSKQLRGSCQWQIRGSCQWRIK